MNVAVVIILYLIFISFEAINFLREKRKKELYVYSIFMMFSLIISLLLVRGVNIPSYDKFVGKIISSIFGEQ